MKVGWRDVTLGEHVDLVTGFPFKSARFLDNSTATIRLLRGDNVGQGFLRWDGAKHWPEIEAPDYLQFALEERDVILAMDRPWIEAGLKYAWVRPSDTPCLLVQRVARLRGINGLLTDYLRYIIGSSAFTAHVKSITTGVNVPHISAKDIKRFRFSLPPVEEQRRIVSILGAYDDLIEVNRRRIALLEEMARRLFEEWFVRFRFPGYEDHAIGDTPDGPLPQGWHFTPLEDMLVLQRGFDLPTSKRVSGDFPVIAASGVHGTHAEAKLRGPAVVTGRSGTIGNVLLIHEDCWPLNTTLYVKEFRLASPTYALQLLRHLDLAARSGGAAVPTLNRNHLHCLLVTCPPADLIARYERIAMVQLKAVDLLTRHQALLAKTRDHILPGLVSGRLSVAVAERELEAVA